MGKHDSKISKIQVDIIDNKNDAVEFIEVRKKMRGPGNSNNNNPNDIAQIKDLEGFVNKSSKLTQEVNAGIKRVTPGPLDASWGPYANIAEACLAIPNTESIVDGVSVNLRLGKIVGIQTEIGIIEFYWKKSFLDSGLVPVMNYTVEEYDIPVKDSNFKTIASAWVDLNNNLLFAMYTDQTNSIDAKYEPSLSKLSQLEILDNSPAVNNGKKLVNGVVDLDNNLLSGTFEDQTVYISDKQQKELSQVTKDYNDFVIDKKYPLPKTVSWNIGSNKWWLAYKNRGNIRYSLVLNGDSFTRQQDPALGAYGILLKRRLIAMGYADGGSGWLSFGRWSNTIASMSQSIDPDKLNCEYNLITRWIINSSNLSPDTYVASTNTAGSTIKINVNEVSALLKILYEVKPGGGTFTYAVNGGAPVTVDTNGVAQDLGVVAINTSGIIGNFSVVLTVNLNVSLFGAINTNNIVNGLVIHKCGRSGGQASDFAIDEVFFKKWMTELNPNAINVMFGTNEHTQSTTPADFEFYIDRIIRYSKAINPTIDISLMCPCQTQLSNEVDKPYILNDYATVLIKLSNKYNTVFHNLQLAFGAWGQWQIDAGFINPDRTHPSVNGGPVIAETLITQFK